MRESSKFALFILVGALIFSLGFYFFQSNQKEKMLGLASDAPKIKGQISVVGDNYLGYWFLTSPEFIRSLRAKGFALNWSNDGGDYADRHKKFSDGKYDIMVLPINSYLFHGKDYSYPGVIPMVLSDSKGADSIVAYKNRITGEDRDLTVNDLNNPGLKIALTPDSPSSFLLNTAIVHFDLSGLKDPKKTWQIETKNGSREAYERFAKGEVDAAVLWEPDVSKALANQGVVAVFGSHQISGMIVDVFVVRREFLLKSPETVKGFFQTYFETLTFYSGNKDQMLKEMEKTPGLESKDAAEKALQRIAWFNLQDNADWFGLNQSGANKREKLVDTISQVTEVMLEIKDLKADPLRNNPYTILNSEVVALLYGKLQSEANVGVVISPVVFQNLPDKEWQGLKQLGTMRVLPILFQSGTSVLTADGKKVVDEVAVALSQNYPQYRILVKGHTSPSGDETANLLLSQERADVVKNYLGTTHSINQDRMKAVGRGSGEQLLRSKGEGELSYRSRLARVEFVLLEDKK